MLGNLCSERVIGTVLLRRKSPESLQYDLEELGTPPYPAETAWLKSKMFLIVPLLQPPAS